MKTTDYINCKIIKYQRGDRVQRRDAIKDYRPQIQEPIKQQYTPTYSEISQDNRSEWEKEVSRQIKADKAKNDKLYGNQHTWNWSAPFTNTRITKDNASTPIIPKANVVVSDTEVKNKEQKVNATDILLEQLVIKTENTASTEEVVSSAIKVVTEEQANNTTLNNNASVLNTNTILNTEENTVLPVEVVEENSIKQESVVIKKEEKLSLMDQLILKNNEKLTLEERKDISNGIWLCIPCSNIIDKDKSCDSIIKPTIRLQNAQHTDYSKLSDAMLRQPSGQRRFCL